MCHLASLSLPFVSSLRFGSSALYHRLSIVSRSGTRRTEGEASGTEWEKIEREPMDEETEAKGHGNG